MEVANIEVIVTDLEGNLLANADVLVKADDFKVEGKTGTTGDIEFKGVPAEKQYTISAHLDGYQDEVADELVLPGRSSITLNMTLLP